MDVPTTDAAENNEAPAASSAPRTAIHPVGIRVGNGRKLGGFCGIRGFRRVKCGKCGICKSRSRLPLRFSRPGPPEWGSGGRWFESSRPDMKEALANAGASFFSPVFPGTFAHPRVKDADDLALGVQRDQRLDDVPGEQADADGAGRRSGFGLLPAACLLATAAPFGYPWAAGPLLW